MTGYRALDMLVKQHAPEVKVEGRKRAPFWRPAPPPVHRDVRTPAWNWISPTPIPADVDQLVSLDVNAAYLAAASSVEVAHGQLERHHRTEADRRFPGYWLIHPPAWNDPRIPHPLGTHAAELPEVWITTPTLSLLLLLQEHGLLELGPVLDAYLSATRCRLRAWTEHVKADRARAIELGHDITLAEIKHGYSAAVTMLGSEEGSSVYRPDWAQHIRAQHAATMWRSAWRLLASGHPVYAARTIDELVISRDDAAAIWRDRDRKPPPPIRIDQTGATLGTLKVKTVLGRRDPGWPA